MTVVYIDRVFALNLLLDYLLLLAAARLCGMPLQRRRLLACAVLGALYAVAVFLPAFRFLNHPAIRIIGGGTMALIAYRPLRQPLRATALFFLLSAALGGAVLAAGLAAGSPQQMISRLYFANISWPILLGTAAMLYVLLQLVFRQAARHGEGELMKIGISVQGREKELLALHDTGNTLRDPVNGQPVLVLELSALQELWDAKTASILARSCSAEKRIAALHREGVGLGFTLLPFRSIGTASGLLLAVRSDYVKVGRATYSRAWIALSDSPVSDSGTYQALWGGAMRGEEYAAIHQQAAQLDPQAQQAG